MDGTPGSIGMWVSAQVPSAARTCPSSDQDLTSLALGVNGIEELLRAYLSVPHRDHREAGCPSAALLDEIGRCGDSTRDAYSKGTSALVDQIASRLSPEDPATGRGRALSVLALMAGSLQMSRAISDPRLSDEILDQGVANALAIAGNDVPAMQLRRADDV